MKGLKMKSLAGQVMIGRSCLALKPEVLGLGPVVEGKILVLVSLVKALVTALVINNIRFILHLYCWLVIRFQHGLHCCLSS
jgi:hypothetical protein